MNTRIALSLSLASALALASGCGGAGDHTRKQANAANEKMSVLKAGTEWSMGKQAFLAGDLDKALTKVENSLNINDTVVKSHVLKGRILIEQGRMGEALESLKLAETYGPLDPDAKYYLAIVYERLGEVELAHENFDAASELDDMNPSYAVAAAEMLITMGELDDAIAYLSSVPTFEHHPGVRQTLGHISMMQHNDEIAVRYFREAQLLEPEDTEIQEDLVSALIAAGKYADADSNLVALISQEGFEKRRDLMHMRARCLMELSRPVEARTIYQDLTADNAGAMDADAWIGLGNSAFLIGDERTLRRAASRIISVDSSIPDGYTLMALYHRSVGSPSDALASIEQSLDVESQDASAHAFRGMLLADLGEQVGSIEAFKIATELDPSNADYQSMLDWAAMGNYATAPTDD
ncbi:MAG: Flp pilus assembly protein TadD [Phycisphaerales bacterium]|jgi:Flp pilus assembly protein TadD